MNINATAVAKFMYEFLKVAPLKHVLKNLIETYLNAKYINYKSRKQCCLNKINEF